MNLVSNAVGGNMGVPIQSIEIKGKYELFGRPKRPIKLRYKFRFYLKPRLTFRLATSIFGKLVNNCELYRSRNRGSLDECRQPKFGRCTAGSQRPNQILHTLGARSQNVIINLGVSTNRTVNSVTAKG